MKCSHPDCTGFHRSCVPASKRCPAATARRNAWDRSYHHRKWHIDPRERARRLLRGRRSHAGIRLRERGPTEPITHFDQETADILLGRK